MTWRTVVRAALVIATVALMIRYAYDLDGGAILRAASAANPWLLIAATAGLAPLVWLKSVRMTLLLGRRIAPGRLMSFFLAGYAADNLLMSQAGIGVRIALVHRDGVPLATAIAIHVVEKVLEAATLALITLPVVIGLHADWLARPISWCLVAAAVGIAAVVLLRSARRTQQVAGLVRPLADPRTAATVVGLSVASWLVEIGMIMATLAALQLDVPLAQASILVIAGVSLAALVPGLPANIGPFEMTCVLALGTFGAVGDRVLGFALVYHALHTIPVTVIGLPGMWAARRRRREP